MGWECGGRILACVLLVTGLLLISLQANWIGLGDLLRRGEAQKLQELSHLCLFNNGDKCDILSPFFPLSRSNYSVQRRLDDL